MKGYQSIFLFAVLLVSMCSASSQVSSLGKISYWCGLVNEHYNTTIGIWQTDPDGVSGCDLDMLTYCQKWYAGATSVVPGDTETISGWMQRGGTTGNFTSTRQVYLCEGNATATASAPSSQSVIPVNLPAPPGTVIGRIAYWNGSDWQGKVDQYVDADGN
jgi:hypothetical protein